MTRPTVLLAMPRVGDMDSFRDRPTPPLSLIHAASGLRPRFRVVLLDQRVEPDWRNRLDDELARGPVLVGLTTMAGAMIGHALRIARHVRSRGDTPLVWGGTHLTLRPEQGMHSDLVDHVVLGEGEDVLPRLARRLEQGRSAADVPGVWTRDRDGVHRNPRSAPLDFAAQPPAPYDLVDMSRYTYSYRGLRYLDYLSSRGCPHGCTYCYNNPFFGRHWSARPAPTVLEELRQLRRDVDFDVVYFLDDNFFVDRPRAWEILGALPEDGLQYALQGVDIQSIDAMSDAELDDLESTGLRKITIGVETGSDRIRRRVGKWGDTDTVVRNLERLADRSFVVLTSFIIGFPFERPEELRQTVDLALRLQSLGDNFRLPQLFNYTPIQGTPLADAMEQQGYRFPDRLQDWASIEWDYNRLYDDDPAKKRRLESLAFLSKFVDRKHLDYGSRSAVGALYRLYRPLALARLRTGVHSFLPERRLYEALKELT